VAPVDGGGHRSSRFAIENVRRHPREGVDDELEVRHRDAQGIVDLVRNACGERPG